MIYESYCLQKQTPTVGLFIMPTDYLVFLENLSLFLSSEAKLSFIKPSDSKWLSFLANQKSFGTYPVGVLQISKNSAPIQIELFFMHYSTASEAKEKWERRTQRVNWDRLLIKFDDQNGCTLKEIEEFDKLPYRNKVFFSSRPYEKLQSVVFVKRAFRYGFVPTSLEPFGRTKIFDTNKVINSL